MSDGFVATVITVSTRAPLESTRVQARPTDARPGVTAVHPELEKLAAVELERHDRSPGDLTAAAVLCEENRRWHDGLSMVPGGLSTVGSEMPTRDPGGDATDFALHASRAMDAGNISSVTRDVASVLEATATSMNWWFRHKANPEARDSAAERKPPFRPPVPTLAPGAGAQSRAANPRSISADTESGVPRDVENAGGVSAHLGGPEHASARRHEQCVSSRDGSAPT